MTCAVLAAVMSSAGPSLGPEDAQAAPVAASYEPDPDWWVTNGRVTDILPVGNRVYLAGGFDYVGPSTGSGVTVNDTTGSMADSWPVVNGPVDASTPDGQGGWYLAGRFTHVGSAYRPGAAHVTGSGAVTAWNPRPVGRVLALATTPEAVILGGEFTGLTGSTAQAARLAAVDRTDGGLLPAWAFAANAAVRSLVAEGASVYAGGDFTVVNGAARTGLARVGVTGAVDPTFVGEVRGSVRGLALPRDGSVLYAAGEFASVAAGTTTLSRSRLAAFATDDGMPSGWNPGADGAVNAIAVDGGSGTVFVGGQFSNVAGAARSRLAALNPSGAATTFDPRLTGCHVRHTTGYAHVNPPCTTEVAALTTHDGVLYVGGRFGASGSVVRHDAAAYRASTGALTDWDPVPGDRVNSLAASARDVFLGGDFTSVNGHHRKGLAALDAQTGAVVTGFRADTDNLVLDLAVSTDGARLYLAGSFTTVQGQPRSKLAAVMVATGDVDPQFRPAFDNDVLTIAYAQGALFAGGQFTSVSGIARSHTVKLNGLTGAVVSTFRADTVGPEGALRAGGMVESLVVSPDGALLYLAGPFLTVNGRSRPGGLAVVYGSTGLLHPRQLGGVHGCSTTGAWITHLYLSADGKRLYGGDVCPDSIYRWDAVNLSSSANPTGLLWRTWCNGGMQAAAEVGGRFYYGTHGSICQVSPTNAAQRPRQRFAVFDVANGVLARDNPSFNSPMGVWAIGSTKEGLLLGGDFTEANGSLRQGLAFLPFTP